MSVCTLCGHPAFNGDGLCSYHFAATGDDWAAGNRIMCDFLHRGILLPASLRVGAGATSAGSRPFERQRDRLDVAR
jgi:hypothetical protein